MSIMIVVEHLLQGHLQTPNVSKNWMRQTKLYIRWLVTWNCQKTNFPQWNMYHATVRLCMMLSPSLSLSLSLSLSRITFGDKSQCLHIYVTERLFPHIQKTYRRTDLSCFSSQGCIRKQGYQCQGRQIPYFSMSDVLFNSLVNLLAHKKL